MRADTLFIDRAAIDVNERVKLIAADEALDAELQITEAGVRHVLGMLRQRFNFIVVDVPVPVMPVHSSGDRVVPSCAGVAGSGSDRAAQCPCPPHRSDRHRRQEPGFHGAQSCQSRRGAADCDDRPGDWAGSQTW